MIAAVKFHLSTNMLLSDLRHRMKNTDLKVIDVLKMATLTQWTEIIRLSTLRPVANDLLNDALRLDNELSALAATCSLRSVSKVQINHLGLQNPL